MAKDPAFLFYSQDFYTGTATMSFEDRGKYITILCLMHQQGRMKEETICFLVGSVSDTLRLKFRIDENGLWYNERLELESTRRAEFTESRRKNGSLGGRPKNSKASAKPSGLHMDNHMGNENEIVIDNINTLVDRKGIEDAIFSDAEFIASLKRTHPGKDLKQAWNECWIHFSARPTKLQDWEWRQKLNTWLSTSKHSNGSGVKINPGKVQ